MAQAHTYKIRTINSVSNTSKPVHTKKAGAKQTGKKEGLPDTPLDRKPKYVQIRDYLSKRYKFRFNTVSLDVEYMKKGREGAEWTISNEADMMGELYEIGFTGFEKQLMTLLKSAFVPKYDPLQEYFESLPEWDRKTDFITAYASFITVTDQQFFQVQFKKMLVRMIAQVFGTISFNKQCFTLYSPQNDGKTYYLEALVLNTPLQPYYKKNPEIVGTGAKRALAENLLLNLDELSALTKHDANQVKATFSESHIKVRLPYDRKDSLMPRKASFVGSTNKREFLTDETGNVRWLVFEVLKINHDEGGPKGYMSVGIGNVWSQAYALFKAGFYFQLTKEDITKSEANNQSYGVNTMEYQLLITYFMPCPRDQGGRFYQPSGLLLRLVELTSNRVRLSDVQIGRACTRLGIPRSSGKVGSNTVYGYYMRENLLSIDDQPAEPVSIVI